MIGTSLRPKGGERPQRTAPSPKTAYRTECGNEAHPDGPWHPGTPLPASWEWRARFMFWWNQRRWGCGCSRLPPFRCHTCGLKTYTERDHVGHICRRIRHD